MTIISTLVTIISTLVTIISTRNRISSDEEHESTRSASDDQSRGGCWEGWHMTSRAIEAMVSSSPTALRWHSRNSGARSWPQTWHAVWHCRNRTKRNGKKRMRERAVCTAAISRAACMQRQLLVKHGAACRSYCACTHARYGAACAAPRCTPRQVTSARCRACARRCERPDT